jgi:hypothetical protein
MGRQLRIPVKRDEQVLRARSVADHVAEEGLPVLSGIGDFRGAYHREVAGWLKDNTLLVRPHDPDEGDQDNDHDAKPDCHEGHGAADGHAVHSIAMSAW